MYFYTLLKLTIYFNSGGCIHYIRGKNLNSSANPFYYIYNKTTKEVLVNNTMLEVVNSTVAVLRTPTFKNALKCEF